MPDVVLYEVSGRVATVTINRPEARNALSAEVRRALPEALRRADAGDDVDAVILTGADPAFCAGLDLKELGDGEHADPAGSAGGSGVDAADHDGDPAAGSPHGSPLEDFGRPIPRLGKPVIGAVNGVAVTGGLELALSCDFLVASERARFADTHARVGIQPGWGLTVLLPEAVGLRRAKEMSATGNFVDAATALAWGLVNHVVPHDELLPFCRQLAADISSNDRLGVGRIFQTYDEGALLTGADAWQLEADAAREWLHSGGGRPDDIAARRRAVIDRGRAQHR